MNLFQKIVAAIGGIGVLALAISLFSVVFVVLLVAAPLLYAYGRWKMGKMRKEFEAQNPELMREMRERQGHAPDGGVIDADYVVIEEEPLDEKRPPKP